MHSNIHCTIVTKSRFRPKLEEKCKISPKVSTNVPIDKIVDKMMNIIMTQVDEKIRDISESSLPRVSNQSFATDKVICKYGTVPMVNSQNSLGGEGTHLVHCTPRISFFSGEDPPNKNKKTYEQWIFYVKTIRPSYTEELLKEAIFGCLKGNAADIARDLGSDTTVDQALDLLDSILAERQIQMY